MREHPIIFSTELIPAILDGSKTQTRRLRRLEEINKNPDDWSLFVKEAGGNLWVFTHCDGVHEIAVKCPYGEVGDRLWVRETWRIESFMDGESLLFTYKDGKTMEEETGYTDPPNYEEWYERVCIQSTDDAKAAFEKGLVRQDEGFGYYRWDIGKSPCRWRSPIFMPRWASRIDLAITEVRLERLQEITEADAIAEGCDGRFHDVHGEWDWTYPEVHFHALWDSINGKKYPWEMNCWVWVLGFKKEMPKGD